MWIEAKAGHSLERTKVGRSRPSSTSRPKENEEKEEKVRTKRGGLGGWEGAARRDATYRCARAECEQNVLILRWSPWPPASS